MWNNGANDLGGNGQKDYQVFWRIAKGKTTIRGNSAMAGSTSSILSEEHG